MSGNIVYSRSPAGEVTSITNQSYTGIYNPANLVSNVLNGPNGPVSYTLGNGLNIYKGYDSLGRPNFHWVCTGPASFNCSTQIYGTSVATTGSRVTQSDDTVINSHRIYGYDDFNRLTSVNSQNSFTYAFDRFGNRWQQNVTAGSGPSPQLSFDQTSNRINSSGYTYDAAGNLTWDGVHTYTYDAEGNLLKVDGGNTAVYVYDALNRRVKVQTSSSTHEYLYDPAGRRVSSWQEPNNAGDEGRIFWDGTQIAFRSNDGTTYFDHQDILGTERMRSNYSGQVANKYTSLAFGDGAQENAPVGSSDQDNLHFALLDYDSESNTEHAQFRNYSSAQGRWMSPDPYDGSYDATNPQSFNRFSYVLNNPLSFVDPLGLDYQTSTIVPCGDSSYCLVVNTTGSDGSSYVGGWSWGGGGAFHLTPFQPADDGPGRGYGGYTGAPNKPTPCKNGLGTGGAGVGAGYNVDAGVGAAGASSTGGVGAGAFHNSGSGFSGGLFGSGGATAYAGSHIAGAPTQTSSTFSLGAYAGAGANFFFTNAGGAQQLSGPFTTVSINVGIGVANLGVQLSFGGGIYQLSVTPPLASVGIGAAGSVVTTNTVATHAGCH